MGSGVYLPSWNMNTGFGQAWNRTLGSGAYSSSSSSTENLSYDEYVRRNVEKQAKLQKELNAISEQRDAVHNEVDKFNKSKNADGTVTQKPELKEMSFWRKLGRGFWEAFCSLGELCKSLIGYEKDGKWNPKKCITNIGIAVLAGLACTFVPAAVPVIAAKLGASAATAITVGTIAKTALITVPTFIAFGGGCIKAGVGVYDACNAETIEEFDKAAQSAGQAAAIAFAAGSGLKKISSAAGVTSQGTGFWSKIGAFFKDRLINPFKAAKVEAKAAVASMEATAASSGLSSIKKLGIREGVKAYRTGIKNCHADVKMKEFNRNLELTRKNLTDRIKELETELNSTGSMDNKEFVSKYLELDRARQTLNSLENAGDNSRYWRTFIKRAKKPGAKIKPYKWYHWRGKKFTVEGVEFTKSELKALNKSISNFGTAKDLPGLSVKDLAVLKHRTMSGVAGSAKYADQVTKFGMFNKWYAQPYNWAVSKWRQGFTKGDAFYAFTTCMAPVYSLNPVLNNPMMAANNIAMLAEEPVYCITSDKVISAEEAAAMEKELLAAKEKIDAQYTSKKKQIDNIA